HEPEPGRRAHAKRTPALQHPPAGTGRAFTAWFAVVESCARRALAACLVSFLTHWALCCRSQLAGDHRQGWLGSPASWLLRSKGSCASPVSRQLMDKQTFKTVHWGDVPASPYGV